MALDRLEVRVSITKILIALIVVIVPLSIVGLILTARSDKALDTAIGNDFKTVADMYSNEVSQFIRDRVADVNIMAAEPVLIDAVSAADRKAGAQAGTAASGAKPAQTKPPKVGGAATAGKVIVGSNASELLRRRREMDPRFLGILATDRTVQLLRRVKNRPGRPWRRNPTGKPRMPTGKVQSKSAAYCSTNLQSRTTST